MIKILIQSVGDVSSVEIDVGGEVVVTGGEGTRIETENVSEDLITRDQQALQAREELLKQGKPPYKVSIPGMSGK